MSHYGCMVWSFGVDMSHTFTHIAVQNVDICNKIKIFLLRLHKCQLESLFKLNIQSSCVSCCAFAIAMDSSATIGHHIL